MKKRILSLLLFCLLLTGCATPALPQTQPTQDGKKFTATFLDVFDTVTTIVGYDENFSFELEVCTCFLQGASQKNNIITVFTEIHRKYHKLLL